MISYEPFWNTLRAKGISTYRLIHYHNISNGTLYRMRHGKALTTVTINDLCGILNCEVQDILRYVPDSAEVCPSDKECEAPSCEDQ